jgi:uncharacterized glyoxalase superfamily protein PhnB
MSIIPILVYPDVGQAVDWLVRVFGLVEHIRIGDHRAQLGLGDGALIVADASHGRRPPGPEGVTHSVMARVRDIDQHHDRAKAAGAEIISGPESQPFGERQYLATDLAGHQWTFTESVLDVNPEEWGGTTVNAW